MILKQTVLVLGAGGSRPYGFPSGPQLLRRIAKELVSGAAEGPHQVVVTASGATWEKVTEFQKDLLNARRLSIDAFIESRSSDYDMIGRCAIAQHLLRLEKDDHLWPKPETDWYTVFFDAILGNSPEAFARNKIRVITFNFDRSFERALYLALRTNFGELQAQALLNVIPIVHVHGDLGAPKWHERFRTDSQARDYSPTSDPARVVDAAGRIQIVHQPPEQGTLALAHEFLRTSARVLFLGFSYHELNLQKLRIPELLKEKASGDIVGTRFGLGDGPFSRVRRLSENTISPWGPGTVTIMDVLSGLSWFYE
jgi:hypothetical protein